MLKIFKAKLKEWCKENRGNWKQRKEDILNQIAHWENIQKQRSLTDDEMLQKVNLSMEFEEVPKREESVWKQRSRVQWLKHGDQNTKFFNRTATSHKRFNSMEQLVVDGNNIQDPVNIKEAVQNFYKDLYKETEIWRPDLRLHEVSRITEEEQIRLQRVFEEEEILKCVNLCASEKAPGPYRFPLVFSRLFGVW